MTKKSNIVVIDGVEYIPKDSMQTLAEPLDGMPYVILRGDRSGVFAGHLKSRKKTECILINARRIWSWAGAASLSQLAVDGTSKPMECKFPAEVPTEEILDVIEILYCTKKAETSIKNVPIWEA